MSGSRRGAGFTLVEICVGLGILSLLFLLATSSFSAFLEVHYLNAYKRQIVSDLREAKHRAVSGGNYSAAHFYPKLGAAPAYYTVTNVKPNGVETLPRRIELPRNLNFSAEKEIRFASSAFCMPGYLGSIYLIGRSGKTKRIVVSSTGRIR